MTTIPRWISEIAEIDVAKGIENCGDEESYLSILEVFHEMAQQKIGEIRRYYEKGDIENYTIQVHALKSSARIIGAEGLSEMAKSLEFAGKAGDLDAIHGNTEELLQKYSALDQKLAAFDMQEEGTKKEFSEEARREAFLTLAEISATMDYGLVEEIISGIKEYKLSEADGQIVAQMEKRLLQLDFDGISNMARSVL